MDTSSLEAQEIGAFSDDLAKSDDLGSVIRAHIHIENGVYSLVENLTPNAEHLKRLDLDYDQTVSLALVLGLDADWVPSLRAIGKLRNRFAHQLGTVLDDSTVNNLYESLPATGKNNVQATFSGLRSAGMLRSKAERYFDLEPKARSN